MDLNAQAAYAVVRANYIAYAYGDDTTDQRYGDAGPNHNNRIRLDASVELYAALTGQDPDEVMNQLATGRSPTEPPSVG